MNHLDLFSGIGGFAYAVDQVWPDAKHTFCEIDPFCQKVLAKHWPESKIYGDIRTITDTFSESRQSLRRRVVNEEERETNPRPSHNISFGFDLLTGGFPCQPFSAAGKRRGTADDRYLWPEMLRVIRLFKPEWVIGENVYGLINIENGLVFEQVCLDLESEGYEVQPFIIPAVAVNAPHRRDRVWIVANRKHARGTPSQITREDSGSQSEESSGEKLFESEFKGASSIRKEKLGRDSQEFWNQDWLEVAARFCRVDDGVSDRVHRLKALGNAIVPQVAIEIMKSIRYATSTPSERKR